jgi:hypothetical protein
VPSDLGAIGVSALGNAICSGAQPAIVAGGDPHYLNAGRDDTDGYEGLTCFQFVGGPALLTKWPVHAGVVRSFSIYCKYSHDWNGYRPYVLLRTPGEVDIRLDAPSGSDYDAGAGLGWVQIGPEDISVAENTVYEVFICCPYSGAETLCKWDHISGLN